MDRNLYKSDKKLASQGWRSMRKALDKEMPEERRRRPVALLWIFALLAPTTGVMGWLMFGPGLRMDTPQGENLPVVSAPALPSVKSEGQTALIPETTGPARPALQLPAGNKLPDEVRPVLAPKVGIRPSKTPGINVTPLRTNGISPEKNTIAAITTGSEAPRPGSQEASGANTLPFNDLLANTTSEPAPTPDGTAETVAGPAVITEIPDVAAATAAPDHDPADTPAASVAHAVVDESFSMPPAPVDPLRVEKNTWAFGANAGVMSDTKGGYAGTGAGLSAEWKPLKKWGVRSGVGYQFRQLSAEERPIVALTASSYVAATGDAKVATANEAFNQAPASAQNSPAPVYVPVGRVHRIEMPVLAFWQPFSKVRVFGGMSVGNNLYVETGDKSLNKNVVYQIQDGNSGRNLNKEVSDELRSWDTRWSIGFGFKPTRHLEVDMFFQKQFQLARNQYDMQGNYIVSDLLLDSGLSGASSGQRGLGSNALFSLAASWFF